MYIANLESLKPSFTLLYKQAQTLLENGKKIVVEVSEKKSKRTLEQNAYYWLFCGELSDFFNDSGLTYGEHQIPYTSELVHEINKKLFGVKTTTKMNIGEFCSYMNKALLFWQEKTNGNFMISELPNSYLERKGYTSDYTRGYL